jgi:hypothetical protein
LAKSIHVSGEALLRTGTGAANALEDLGVSVDGVDIAITDHTDPIYTDTFGPDVPFDEQQFLADAVVSAQLVFYDELVLAKLRGRANAGDGQLGSAGQLWGAGGKYFRLLIASPTDIPYNFLHARLQNAFSQKVGTRKTIWQVQFYCSPYTGSAGGTSGTVLYNQVTT